MGLQHARFPFLARLGRDGRRELGALPPTRVAARRQLIQRGDPSAGAYFVTRGSLRVYYITPEGREATLYAVEPGGTCILALTSSFTGDPFPAWVQAGAGGATFVCVPSSPFRRLLDAEPAFREFVFGVLGGRVFELMRALEEIGSATLEQRIARWLLRQCDGDGVVRVSQLGIASELGTAREVVFRALRSLGSRGLVQTGRVRVMIRDREGLRRVAEP